MTVDWTSVSAMVGFGVVIFGIAAAWYRGLSGLSKRLGQLNERTTRLEAESRLFWTVLQPHLAEIIHSPTHPRRDFLVDQFNETEMNNEELVELAELLDVNIKENCDTAKRLASALLLGRVEAALLKRGAPRWREGKEAQ
jgi:hypothetical protein